MARAKPGGWTPGFRNSKESVNARERELGIWEGTGNRFVPVDSSWSKVVGGVLPETYGAIGDGVTDDSAAFEAAGAAGETITVPRGTYLIGANTTIASSVIMQHGAIFKRAAGITLTFSGRFTGQWERHFSGTGTTAFSLIQDNRVAWFGADEDADAGPAINEAVIASGDGSFSNPRRIIFTRGHTYYLSTAIRCEFNDQTWMCQDTAFNSLVSGEPTVTFGKTGAFRKFRINVHGIRVVKTDAAGNNVADWSIKTAGIKFVNTDSSTLINPFIASFERGLELEANNVQGQSRFECQNPLIKGCKTSIWCWADQQGFCVDNHIRGGTISTTSLATPASPQGGAILYTDFSAITSPATFQTGSIHCTNVVFENNSGRHNLPNQLAYFALLNSKHSVFTGCRWEGGKYLVNFGRGHWRLGQVAATGATKGGNMWFGGGEVERPSDVDRQPWSRIMVEDYASMAGQTIIPSINSGAKVITMTEGVEFQGVSAGSNEQAAENIAAYMRTQTSRDVKELFGDGAGGSKAPGGHTISLDTQPDVEDGGEATTRLSLTFDTPVTLTATITGIDVNGAAYTEILSFSNATNRETTRRFTSVDASGIVFKVGTTPTDPGVNVLIETGSAIAAEAFGRVVIFSFQQDLDSVTGITGTAMGVTVYSEILASVTRRIAFVGRQGALFAGGDDDRSGAALEALAVESSTHAALRLSHTTQGEPVNLYNSTGGHLNIVPTSGRVGINTVAPAEALHVTGSMRATTESQVYRTSEGTVAVFRQNSGGTNNIGFFFEVTDATPEILIKAFGTNPANIKFHLGTEGNPGSKDKQITIQRGGNGGNVGINNTSPNDKALLDLTSTVRGFLPPRMTTTQRDAITTPPAGLMVYNTSTNKLNFYNGSAWEAVTSA